MKTELSTFGLMGGQHVYCDSCGNYFVVVLALVVRKQNIENQKRVKELVFLSACGNEEAKRALEKANLSPQEYSQLLETALREKAENGSSVAARLLGTRFYTEGDFKQAYKWYRRAAEAGDLPAMHQLAEDRFAERCGMNPEESFKWKLYAANHGDGENMFYTAMSLATGVGVQKSIKEAGRHLLPVLLGVRLRRLPDLQVFNEITEYAGDRSAMPAAYP